MNLANQLTGWDAYCAQHIDKVLKNSHFSILPTLFPHIRPAGIFLIVYYSKVTYIRPKATVHKCAGIIRARVLFEGGPYMRKYIFHYNISFARLVFR